jgi:hypothetical protein
MEKTGNPLFDATLQQHLDEIAKLAKGTGREAAYARLFQRLNPHEIGFWIGDETKRGEQTPGQLITLVASFMGACLSVTATTFPKASPLIILAIIEHVNAYAANLLSGQVKAEGVVMDTKTGKATDATMAGILQGRNPFERH